jgi:hypothetical protein
MSAILKVKIPFFRRKTNGGTDGLATFYLESAPTYLPQLNQVVLITHTSVPPNSGLKTKINNISTNTVPAIFQSFEQNTSQDAVAQTDEFANFMILQYDDRSFSTSQFGGDCRGYIEYDVNPEIYSVLKPIESAVIVGESVPFDLNDGIVTVPSKVEAEEYPQNYLRGMFVRRKDTNSVFSNLLKSLNLPVSDDDIKSYTRSQYGTLSPTNGTTYDTVIDGTRYIWTPLPQDGSVTEFNADSLVVHPRTGWVGEYYGTALQTIGSYEYTPNNKAATPIENDLYLLFEIPSNAYGEIIDGKSFRLTLPYYNGTTDNAIDEILGYYMYDTANPLELNAYGTYNKKNIEGNQDPLLLESDDPLPNLDSVLSELDLSVKDIGIRPDLNSTQPYESNIVLLFSDEIKPPQGSNFESWESGYVDIIDGTRVFTVGAQEKALYDHNRDECIGFVALDKGFIVITHPKVVDAYFVNVFGGDITKSNTSSIFTAKKNYNVNGEPSDSLTRGFVKTSPQNMITTLDENEDVVWDSTQFVFSPQSGALTEIDSFARYISYNTEKSLNIVCLASADEFFRSTNKTAKELLGLPITSDFANFKSSSQNLYPIVITQLGIHDVDGNLLAICKPSQPIKKYWYDIASFNIKIRL